MSFRYFFRTQLFPFILPKLFVSTEDGVVTCIDVRDTSKSLYSLKAHDLATNAVTFSKTVPNLMATASIDKSVKLWNIEGNTPTLVSQSASFLSVDLALGVLKAGLGNSIYG